ncbi:hypothetical protein [Chloroflexus sp.]|uniref:hypothetical protein n=1 Tax=Chloroflexus sp. TaxID=1904827 RepID=UPI002ACD91E2|nr:hypothetical protein [Chloroflexus sp.]
MALVAGIALAPLVLPLIASWGGKAAAQSLPWTPTPEPTDLPVPSRTPTVIATVPVPSPLSTATMLPSATPNPDPNAPILGTAVVMTPIYTAPAGQEPGTDSGSTDGGSTSGGSTSGTATPTPEPGTQPDLCEPNDSLTRPCSLPTEVENSNLTFVDDSIDVFSLLLKGGRTYTLRASSSTGIDPFIRLYRAEDTATPLTENDDLRPGTTDAEVKVTTNGDGWYLVVVENKAPGHMRGRIYSFSARSSAAEQPTANPAAATQQALRPVAATVGDVFENNYSPETAATLVWGVPFDLSLVCPVQGQCSAGDHDFFWVPVKAGVQLVAVTYDLGPGADPAITLYRPEANFTDPSTSLAGWRAWAGNDDVVPGFTLRSQLLVAPDWDGYALLVVASSRRTDPPPMPPAVGAPGRYRLMVGPPSLAPVQDVLRAQNDIPAAPTTAPTVPPPTSQPVAANVAPTPVTDAREVIKEKSIAGEAVVVVDGTRLYAAAPPSDDDELAVYPEGAVVILMGEAYAGWVKVQPLDSVVPGWMFGPNLRPLNPVRPGAAATATTPGSQGVSAPTVSASGDAPTVSAGGTGVGSTAPQLTVLTPLPTPSTASVSPQARAATIEVCAVTKATESGCPRPLEGVRVELVRVADGAVLFVGLTDRTGRVAPSIQVSPGTAVDVQIGALGIRAPLPTNEALLPVRVVEGGV